MGEKHTGGCRKCGWTGSFRSFEFHRRPQDGQWCNYIATPLATPTDAKPAGEA